MNRQVGGSYAWWWERAAVDQLDSSFTTRLYAVSFFLKDISTSEDNNIQTKMPKQCIKLLRHLVLME